MSRIGIIGAGTMGEGVAHCLLEYGFDVVLHDIIPAVLEKAEKNIEKKIRINQMMSQKEDDFKGSLKITTDLSAVSEVSIVIENIIEDVNAKKSLYKSLDNVCQKDCIYMVNTSCISITEIASATNRQDKVIGTHFMNPVHMIKAVEIIKGFYTSEDTIKETIDFMNKIEKESIIVNDYPGFVSNRISHLMMNEAAFLVQDNVATPEDIDDIFRSCYGHKMGPLETADLIGIDTVVYSLEVLYNSYQDTKFRCCPLLKKMVNANLLGQKTKKGFYEY